MPTVAAHWWESNLRRAIVTAAITLPFLAWWLGTRGVEGQAQLLHSFEDYLAFIALLGSLYVISGGIHVAGSLSGTPLANTGLLAIGAVLANLIGTTGASMVLLRPLLRANRHRRRQTHLVVFFIFVVSNTAGLLTPLGDPPLYLGFLQGVPFEWTLRLLPEWLVVNGLLLVVFNVVDQKALARDERETRAPLLEEVQQHGPVRIDGALNVAFLVGIALVALARGRGWGHGGRPWPFGVAEAVFAALALAAWFTTSPALRAANRFTFAPMVEVAVLFCGVFLTMTAPLRMLNEHGAGLGLTEPWQCFWMSGLVSAVLDNAPTYLSFAVTLAGRLGIGVDTPRYLAQVAGGEGAELLAAISCGSVFMGALTYVGNGPNFMVKSMAESAGVRMPTFFGYLRWSFPILLPLFALVTWIFFL